MTAKSFVNQVLRPAYGWNVIPSISGYDAPTYDISTAMKKVHVDFMVTSLFNVKIGTDWNDYTKNVIEVSNLHMHILFLFHLTDHRDEVTLINTTAESYRLDAEVQLLKSFPYLDYLEFAHSNPNHSLLPLVR